MRFVSILVFVLSSIVIAGCGSNQRQGTDSTMQVAAGRLQVYVRVPQTMLSQSWVLHNEFNRDHGGDREFALGWISVARFAALSAAEKSSILILDEERVARGLLNPFTLEDIHPLSDDVGFSEGYHNYQALTAELKNLANAHSDIAQLDSAGKSTEDRALWMMRITQNIAAEVPKPKLLYIANMHGDEVVGRELAIYYIRRLLNDYGKDPRVTNLVNNAEIFIIPSMNPDGYEKAQRANANGKDLNRSFPDFTSDNHDTPAGRPAEVAAVMELHRKHHFMSALNFHGGDVCFNLPWDTKPNQSATEKFGDDAVISGMGRTYADSNATMVENSGGSFNRGLTYGYEWYEVNGGMQDWSIYYRGSMHGTVELSKTKWPSESYLPVAWKENQDAMLAYMERSLHGIHLNVVDSTGAPVSNITVGVQSSTRTITFSGNLASRVTTNGPQTVTVGANGFKTMTLHLTARSFDGNYQRVVLTK